MENNSVKQVEYEITSRQITDFRGKLE